MFYNLKIPVDCTNEAEATNLQKELESFKLLNTKMMMGLVNLQRKNPALVRNVLAAASSGNIGGAIAGIMKAM